MTFEIKFLPAALEDLQAVIKWYENESPGLGKRFFVNFQNQLESIRLSPLKHQKTHKELRSSLIRKFPIQIHYQFFEKENRIVVFAITHSSRDPQVWKKRKE